MRSSLAALIFFVACSDNYYLEPSSPRNPNPAPFPAYTQTWISWTHHVAMHASIPARVEDCRPLEEIGASCADVDNDQLTDAWEDLVLQDLSPVVRFSVDEPMFDDPEAVMRSFGRVHPREDDVLVTIVIAYAKDYGSCEVGSHAGDAERVAFTLRLLSPHAAVIDSVYLAAHEGTGRDGGQRFFGDRIAGLDFVARDRWHFEAAARWLVFASEGKHATYASSARCEDESDLLCLEEDCGPPLDPSFGLSAIEHQHDIPLEPINVGEPDAHRIDALDNFGFAGENVWSEQLFCGGVDTSGCAPSIRSKLLDEPI
jgi:hypothetical protein